MRVALVGWDIDEAIAGALAGLGVDLIAFTRWHEGMPYRQAQGGWVLERCPHRIGGGVEREALSFRESIASRDATYYGVNVSGYDVIHALDAPSVVAADALAETSPGAARLQSVRGGGGAVERPDGRAIYEHPATAEAAEVLGGTVVPTWAALRPGQAAIAPREAPTACVWVPRLAQFDPAGIAEGLQQVRGSVADLGAIVLGAGPLAEALRRHLAARGMLVRPLDPAPGGPEAHWTANVGSARVLLVPGPEVARDPAARCAGALGVPVLALGTGSSEALATALTRLFREGVRAERTQRAATALARRALDPAGVAAGWLGAYLDAVAGAPTGSPTEPAPMLPGAARSRLHLVAVSAHEAYAIWHLDPRDWLRAREWLGADATAAFPVIRLQDVTALAFRGDNAHHTWDVELGYGERGRLLRFDGAGLSLAASLGVRAPRGAFLPMARAALVHLPADAPTTHPAARRLGVMPRRSG